LEKGQDAMKYITGCLIIVFSAYSFADQTQRNLAIGKYNTGKFEDAVNLVHNRTYSGGSIFDANPGSNFSAIQHLEYWWRFIAISPVNREYRKKPVVCPPLLVT
jgi:hypothetical protein